MRKLIAGLALVLGLGPLKASADIITYDFVWTGINGYSMVGFFTYDDANAADGAIRDGEVQSLYFEAFQFGVSFASNSDANFQPGFNFNFDTTAGQFFLNGISISDAGQIWNQTGTGLGWGSGSGASALFFDGVVNFDSIIANPVPLTATLRASVVPEPGTLALLSLSLAGLAVFCRRKRTTNA